MIPEILDIQERIGADPELMEALEAVAQVACRHEDVRYETHRGDRCLQTGYYDVEERETCFTCGAVFVDEEIEQELARQAESGGAR